jgi:hypothetical protein
MFSQHFSPPGRGWRFEEFDAGPAAYAGSEYVDVIAPELAGFPIQVDPATAQELAVATAYEADESALDTLIYELFLEGNLAPPGGGMGEGSVQEFHWGAQVVNGEIEFVRHWSGQLGDAVRGNYDPGGTGRGTRPPSIIIVGPRADNDLVVHAEFEASSATAEWLNSLSWVLIDEGLPDPPHRPLESADPYDTPAIVGRTNVSVNPDTTHVLVEAIFDNPNHRHVYRIGVFSGGTSGEVELDQAIALGSRFVGFNGDNIRSRRTSVLGPLRLARILMLVDPHPAVENLYAFLTNEPPAGAIEPHGTYNITNNHLDLEHPVGVNWASRTEGTIPRYDLPSDTGGRRGYPGRIVEDSSFRSFLYTFLDGQNLPANTTTEVTLEGRFEMSSIPDDGDLPLISMRTAFENARVDLDLEVETDSNGIITRVVITDGYLWDIYDWAYRMHDPHFIESASDTFMAQVQGGFPTVLQDGGQPFAIFVHLDGREVVRP